MTEEYQIEGMTCMGCANRVKNKLLALDEVEEVQIDLATGQTILIQKKSIDQQTLATALGTKYTLTKTSSPTITTTEDTTNISFSWKVYQPLFLIIGYILGTCILVQYPFDNFSGSLLMRHFMAGFFLVFSFFKLLNVRGFAESYAMYDLISARWKPWGWIYPFVELTLGILYLTNSFPWYTNWMTVIILGVSSIGVIKSNLEKQKIKCACLGDVFNLPMSTITIIEDVTMIAMAAFMLF
ncbi:MAG: heavy-metal-associated domain-containing protein [Aureispira sp.]